jgi:hypothetical protein
VCLRGKDILEAVQRKVVRMVTNQKGRYYQERLAEMEMVSGHTGREKEARKLCTDAQDPLWQEQGGLYKMLGGKCNFHKV